MTGITHTLWHTQTETNVTHLKTNKQKQIKTHKQQHRVPIPYTFVPESLTHFKTHKQRTNGTHLSVEPNAAS